MGNHQLTHQILIPLHNSPTKQLRRRKTNYNVVLPHITLQFKTNLKIQQQFRKQNVNTMINQ